MAAISNTKTPFVFATVDELSMLINEADSANTKKQISFAVKQIKLFASSAGVPPIETMNQTKLDSLWANLRRVKEGRWLVQIYAWDSQRSTSTLHSGKIKRLMVCKRIFYSSYCRLQPAWVGDIVRRIPRD